MKSLAEFYQGWADDVDFDKKVLTIEEAVDDPSQGRALTTDKRAHQSQIERKREKETQSKDGELFDMKWDKLVVGVGCYAQTFDTKGVKANAYFLKDVGDARRIRNRVLSCFEAAALPTTSEDMKKILLNFAVVGGGPTGIEWSAELHDIISQNMSKLYPDLVDYAQITVYDVAPKVLSMFDEKLSQYAMNHFRREGIKIKTSRTIEELRPGAPSHLENKGGLHEHTSCYTLKLKEDGEIGVGICVWSTGLMMNPFVAHGLAGKVKHEPKSGGIVVNDRLQVKREDDGVVPDVYALGDCARMDGTTWPATAQVASQEASWLAKRLNKGDVEQQKFTYKDLGVMAYIGNQNALLQSGGAGDISGRVAWYGLEHYGGRILKQTANPFPAGLYGVPLI